jgi:hypothetical protein
VQNVNAWTKAGLMFREASSTGALGDPGAKYVFVIVSPGKGVTLQYRASTGGAAVSASAPLAGTAPGWVRLVRRGDVFTAYWSTDFTTWATVGSATVPLAFARVHAGVALTSHNPSTAATASFDDLVIRQ